MELSRKKGEEEKREALRVQEETLRRANAREMVEAVQAAKEKVCLVNTACAKICIISQWYT